jgi:hypothetical protein
MWYALTYVIFAVVTWNLLDDPDLTSHASLGQVMLISCGLSFLIIFVIRLFLTLLLLPFRGN